jgi:hypothetical protein
MRSAKRKTLEEAGWRVGSVDDFLGLDGSSLSSSTPNWRLHGSCGRAALDAGSRSSSWLRSWDRASLVWLSLKPEIQP